MELQSAASVCAALDGLTILYAGDSVIEQVFISTAHLLGANFSDQDTTRWDHDYKFIESLVCRGRLRVQYIRSDLLFWYASRKDLQEVNRFRFFPALQDFRAAANAADVVVLGGGHHYSNRFENLKVYGPFGFLGRVDSIWGHGLLSSDVNLTWTTFFTEALNHTMTRIVASRAAIGKPASSLLVLSTTKPIAKCYLHTEPIQTHQNGTWTGRTSSGSPLPKEVGKYASQYVGFGRYANILRDLSVRHGSTFCDIHNLSALRPDAAKARFLPEFTLRRTTLSNGTKGFKRVRWADDDRDCLHSCLPGPVDTWSLFLFHMIRQRAPPSSLRRVTASPKGPLRLTRRGSDVPPHAHTEVELTKMWWFPRMTEENYKREAAANEREKKRKQEAKEKAAAAKAAVESNL